VYQIATSAVQLANCVLLRAYLRTVCETAVAEHKQNIYTAYLNSCHKNIFDFKLNTN